eukprot:1328738-Rhodomonas_salina.4
MEHRDEARDVFVRQCFHDVDFMLQSPESLTRHSAALNKRTDCTEPQNLKLTFGSSLSASAPLRQPARSNMAVRRSQFRMHPPHSGQAS